MNSGETEVRRQFLTPTAVAHIAFVPTGILTILLGPLLPSLEARWSLNDAQAGELFSSQFLASTVGVAVSGMLVPRFGYRVVLVLGLACMGLGVGTLPLGSWAFGMASVACFGTGLGLVIPTANLLVAEENPHRKASALSVLNFFWSVGAVACPFLLAPFQQIGRTSTFLFGLGIAIALLALLLASISLPRPAESAQWATESKHSFVSLMRTKAAVMLGALFFLYVGTETAVGGWVASYAKRITNSSDTMWVATPSFFYGALLVGRALAPIGLRRISDLNFARLGLATALLGVVALVASQSLAALLISAVVIGLGFSAIYPITIALLSHKFGSAATRLGSVMFALAGFGGACVPWLVGLFSTEMSSLQLALIVPAAGCAAMLAIYLMNWQGAL